MNCQEYFERIELLSSLEQNGPEHRELLSHLDACPECMEYFVLTREFDRHLIEEFANIEVSQEVGSKIRTKLCG